MTDDMELIQEYRSIEKEMKESMTELHELSHEWMNKSTELRDRVHRFKTLLIIYGEGDIIGELSSMMSTLKTIKDDFSDIYNKSVGYTEQEDKYI